MNLENNLTSNFYKTRQTYVGGARRPFWAALGVTAGMGVAVLSGGCSTEQQAAFNGGRLIWELPSAGANNQTSYYRKGEDRATESGHMYSNQSRVMDMTHPSANRVENNYGQNQTSRGRRLLKND